MKVPFIGCDNDPEGRPGMSDVSSPPPPLLPTPSGLESLGCYLIPLYYLLSCSMCLLLLLFLSCLFLPAGPFFWLFPQKILLYFLFKDRRLGMALGLQLGDDSWSVVCAAFYAVEVNNLLSISPREISSCHAICTGVLPERTAPLHKQSD